MALDHATDTLQDSRLNELYWNSSRTVDEITTELGVGRSALYASIHPLPTGSDCGGCGDVLVFTNRTNRASRLATCPTCGVEAELAEREPDVDDAEVEGARLAGWRNELRGVAPDRAAMIGGAAALGVVIGAAAVKAFRD